MLGLETREIWGLNIEETAGGAEHEGEGEGRQGRCGVLAVAHVRVLLKGQLLLYQALPVNVLGEKFGSYAHVSCSEHFCVLLILGVEFHSFIHWLVHKADV